MSAQAIQLKHMNKKFEINRTKIKGGCQLERKVVPHNSKNDLPLVTVFGLGRSFIVGMYVCDLGLDAGHAGGASHHA